MNSKSYFRVDSSTKSNNSSSSKFFKPLIASSLSLVLTSIAMGQTFESMANKSPKTTITTNESGMKDTHLNWDMACDRNGNNCNGATRKVVWSSTSNGNGQTWTATTQSTTGSGNDSKVVDRVELFFGNNSNTASQIWVLDSKENVSLNNNNKDNYVSVIGSKDASKIAMDFENTSLGRSDDKINLFINFANTANKTAEVTNLKDLYGNLYLTTGGDGGSGSGIPMGNKYKVEVDSIYGDIYTRARKESLSGWVFIKNKLEGNITTDDYSNTTMNQLSTPTVQVIFDDGASMRGNIGDYVKRDDAIKREVIFKGSGKDGYVLKGNIISYSSSNGEGDPKKPEDEGIRYSDQGSNFVWFYKGNMDGSIIASGNVVGSNATNTVKRGNNVVYFGDPGESKPSDISVDSSKSSSINGANGANGDTYGTSFNLTGGILAQLFSTSNNNDSGKVGVKGNDENRDGVVATNSIHVGKGATLNLTGSGIDTSIRDRGNNGNNNKFMSNNPSKGLDSGLRGEGQFTVFKDSIVARGYASNNVYLSDDARINLGSNGEGMMYTTIDNLNMGRAPKTVSNLYINGKNATFNGNIVSDGNNDGNIVINGNNNSLSKDQWVGKGSQGTATNNIIVRKGGSGSILGNITSIGGGINNISFENTPANGMAANGKSGGSGNDTSTLTLKGSTNQINTLMASAGTTSTLILDSSSNKQNVSINNISGSTTNGMSSNLNIDFKGDKGSILSLGNNSSLSSRSTAYNINALTSSGANNTINLSGQAYGSNHTPSRNHFQTLTINKIDEKNPINFILYVNPNANNNDASSTKAKAGNGASTSIKADRIIIEGVDTNGAAAKATAATTPTHYLAISNAADIVGKDLKDKHIALATVKNNGGSGNSTPVVNLQATNAISGFSVISFDMHTAQTDKDGKAMSGGSGNGYTTYFLGTAKSNGASYANQKASAAAMGSTYDLYLANMNSLNKRMGELRDNPKGQGVWARIFTGMQTSKFALETNAFYTTIQGGYDYAFGFNGANNYLGVALSYANSITTSKSTSDFINNIAVGNVGINSVNSNAVEFAIYNAYVQDGGSKASAFKNGLYNDTVLKFSYINSSISMLGQDASYSTNSFAFTLSDEIGYRFILGQSNEWYIDPQAELAFGYLNQSDFIQKLKNAQGISSLKGSQEAILTLRGRVGSSFGYKFDKFTEGKNFKAQAYLGTYFVGDYIAGGDINLTDNFGKGVLITPLESTARFTLNLGTNIAIKDDHRIYFDFERSFGGSIITQYQFNLGYRYSFGESKYTPYSGVSTDMSNASDAIKEVAPTQGYYIEVLTSKKASKKELRVLKGINNLKTQNIGDSKSYLIGPFKSIDEAKNEKNNYEGVLKELGSEGEVIEVE